MVRRSFFIFLSRNLTPLLIFLIFLFSSTQLGLHFWPSSAFVYGLRIDYLSPTLYFLDLLILLYLFIQHKTQPSLTINHWILPILLVNLLFTRNPLATLSWSLHLMLYLSFISSLKLVSLRQQVVRALRLILPLVLLFQLALGGLQVFYGHSLQGIFYILGERTLSLTSPSVAKSEFFGSVLLRAYGTFSHPNILAGWSVVALLILIHLVRSHKKSSPPSTYYLLLTTAVISTIIFLTESRAAALSLFGFVVPFLLLSSLKARLFYFSLGLTIFLILLPTGLLSQRLDVGASERLTLTQTSFLIIKNLPLFGAGASAALTTYPTLSPNLRLLQPDHNSPTLFLSWFGILGTVAFLYVLSSFKLLIPSFSLLLPLLPLFLFDHYFLTSPQGLFLILLYLKVGLFVKFNHYENH